MAALSRAVLAAPAVVINEVNFAPANKRPLEFVELLNPGADPVNLSGWRLNKFTIPPDTSLAPGGFLVIAEDPAELKKEYGVAALGPMGSRLSNKGEKLALTNAEGVVVEEVSYGAVFRGRPRRWGWAVRSSGFIPLSMDRCRETGARLDSSMRLRRKAKILIPAGSKQWHWRKGTSEASKPISAWRDANFQEDDSWKIGTAGFGYGDDDDATVVPDMQGRYTSLFLRHRFAP
jgi:hypothetical protein